LLVHAVETGGPADRAGIRQGDLIVAVAGTPVTSVDELAASLEVSEEGGTIDLGVVRGVEELAVVVDLRGGGTADEGGV
jgi:putative serine protease PepD